ncbi:MAG: hypothetical protein J07HQW2_03349 [Haloquadratum walsbyi J07HQW2]|uniref:Uncharacterized protein n=1 Tax=Haloquadratum walsbyi J07HQW2 TaxID=1238425 RepID=U1NI75_9EURY|nr:MAG: hypothetical protein J07HQW2_03349 [Haloquadratum walsbyi J07HQW2]
MKSEPTVTTRLVSEPFAQTGLVVLGIVLDTSLFPRDGTVDWRSRLRVGVCYTNSTGDRLSKLFKNLLS